MSTQDIKPEVLEGRDALEDVQFCLEDTANWCSNNAHKALTELHNEWQKLCNTAKPEDLESFRQQCEDILKNCEVFYNEILKKAQTIKDLADNRFPVISTYAGDDPGTKAFMAQIQNLHENIVHPKLLFLFEKMQELESSIRDMIEFSLKS